MFGLGKYPEVSLKEAREKARDAKKLVAEGIDPRAYKKEQKAALILEKGQSRYLQGSSRVLQQQEGYRVEIRERGCELSAPADASE